MSDDVMVRPIRPYLEGDRIKDQGDEPYPVGRSRALELRGNGLVEWVAPTPPAAAEPEKPTPRARRA